MPLVHCEKSVIHPHPAFGHLLPHREKEMGGGTVCSVCFVGWAPLGQALGQAGGLSLVLSLVFDRLSGLSAFVFDPLGEFL